MAEERIRTFIAKYPEQISQICWAISEYKGFRADPMGQTEAHIWKQLCHLMDELEEWRKAPLQGKPEELADVAIVLADLATMFGYYLVTEDFTVALNWTINFTKANSDEYYIDPSIIAMMRVFRKTGTISRQEFEDAAGRIFIVSTFRRMNLLNEIERKCLKNLDRPSKYGTKHGNEADSNS